MNNNIFKGIFTALITPFTSDSHELDLKAFSNFVEWQIEQGIHGLVPCGTTGETSVLTDDEYKLVVERCIDIAKGKCPVIVGAGSNNTKKSASMGAFAREKGADGILVVAPYYNKPSQDGMIAHFSEVAKTAQIPMIVYNIPGRSVVNITADTMARLSRVEHIIGVKDATGDLTRPTQTRLDCGADFIQLSGEDATVSGYLAQGGHGAISVASNVAPALMADLYNSWVEKDMARFAMLRDKLFPLADHLFKEPSPAPAKYAVSEFGLCHNSLRLPLLPCTSALSSKIDSVLNTLHAHDTVAPKYKMDGTDTALTQTTQMAAGHGG